MAQAKGTSRAKRQALTDEQKSPRGSFVRLAQARMSVAIKAIRALGDLSGPSYEYTPADVKEMQEAIGRELNASFRRLVDRKAIAKSSVFTFGR